MDLIAMHKPRKNLATLIFVFLSFFLNIFRIASSQETPVAAPCKAIVATSTGVDIIKFFEKKKRNIKAFLPKI
jgi:hypothetical protein